MGAIRLETVDLLLYEVEDDLGRAALRAAADRDDRTSASFLEHVSFAAISRAERQSPQGRVAVTVFERRLEPAVRSVAAAPRSPSDRPPR